MEVRISPELEPWSPSWSSTSLKSFIKRSRLCSGSERPKNAIWNLASLRPYTMMKTSCSSGIFIGLSGRLFNSVQTPISLSPKSSLDSPLRFSARNSSCMRACLATTERSEYIWHKACQRTQKSIVWLRNLSSSVFNFLLSPSGSAFNSRAPSLSRLMRCWSSLRLAGSRTFAIRS